MFPRHRGTMPCRRATALETLVLGELMVADREGTAVGQRNVSPRTKGAPESGHRRNVREDGIKA